MALERSEKPHRHRLGTREHPMNNSSTPVNRLAAAGPAGPRTALLAGATGLIGRELLPLLLEGERYGRVHVLLRRSAPDLPRDRRLTVHQVNFAALPALPAVDDVFIALGTTIKAAGSQAAFRAVDFDAVVQTAKAARAAGACRLAVVSALGADSTSSVFYNRVKGEMQAAVAELGYDSVQIAQPSLLVGDREALGQPARPGEVWATRLLRPVMGLVPASVRPIEAHTVAQALLRATLAGTPGVHLLASARLQAIGRQRA
jgi:uncharacterized protein YbjT (DUF2867 family)